jgi:hypothetical protein
MYIGFMDSNTTPNTNATNPREVSMSQHHFGPECPACSGRLHRDHEKVTGVSVCKRCGAVHGQCWKGNSPVLLVWDAPDACRPEEQVFFDLTLVGSAGVEHIHGWFNPATRKVTQVG